MQIEQLLWKSNWDHKSITSNSSSSFALQLFCVVESQGQFSTNPSVRCNVPKNSIPTRIDCSTLFGPIDDDSFVSAPSSYYVNVDPIKRDNQARHSDHSLSIEKFKNAIAIYDNSAELDKVKSSVKIQSNTNLTYNDICMLSGGVAFAQHNQMLTNNSF